MLKVITSPDQAYGNILRFEKELKNSPEMQARLSYARAWYAYRDERGTWSFAPAKFAGYQDIDASSYLEGSETETGDGRRTEAQLRMFFRATDPATPLHGELVAALFAFLAKYGKTPSMKIRINVMKDGRERPAEGARPIEAPDEIVDLLLAVSKILPAPQFKRLLAGLSKHPLAAEDGGGQNRARESPASL